MALDAAQKLALQVSIQDLQSQYRSEMIAQNNKGSMTRSYAQADRIQDQIRNLEITLRGYN